MIDLSSPTSEQWRQWREEGVVPLPDALTGASLATVQQSFDAAAEKARPAWLEAVAAGTLPAAFFDIPQPLAQDPLFFDLVDHAGWYGHLRAFTDERVTFIQPQFRTVPPSPLSYVGWHYDVPRHNPLHLKVQIYLDDVSRDEGAFAYVPGSHLADSGPYPLVGDLAAMPGHHVYGGRAGSAVLFNSYGLHTSMVNRSRRPRRSIILIYEVGTAATFDPRVYAGFDDRCVTPERRQLFRLEPRPEPVVTTV
ncbi:MAG TPA: hypothetical protein DIC52_24850 [Candidatus Latescibacteria bacterium]|nr:hypothetical protein [Candidatus Latescibacterota bacterium]